MERMQYVIVAAIDHKLKQIPMVIKNKPDYLKGALNLVGGKIEAGETPEQAAIRELKEETGLEPLQLLSLREQMGFYSRRRRVLETSKLVGVIHGSKSDIHCVYVKVAKKDISQGEGETEKVDWYDLTTLETNPILMPNLRLVIPLVLAGWHGWKIYDIDGDWKQEKHKVQLQAPNWGAVDVIVNGMKFYEGK